MPCGEFKCCKSIKVDFIFFQLSHSLSTVVPLHRLDKTRNQEFYKVRGGGCKDVFGLYFNQYSLLYMKILSKSFQQHLIRVQVL